MPGRIDPVWSAVHLDNAEVHLLSSHHPAP